MADHIMHLEDEPEWREIVKDLLSHRYQVHTATTLHVAAEMLIEFTEAQRHFSAAIFDISLVEGISNPARGMDQNEDALNWITDLRAYLEEKGSNKEPLPIIILSGRSELVDRLRRHPDRYDIVGAFDKATLADETEQFCDLITAVTKQEQENEREQKRAEQVERTYY